jgi:anti-sigma B factor antagonist
VIQSAPFEMSSEVQGDRGRLTVTGELDIATAPQLDEAAAELLANGIRQLLIDLSGLSFIDSSGLRTLIGLNDRAAVEDWTLSLVRPSEPSLSVFQITGADENLPFIEERSTQ